MNPRITLEQWRALLAVVDAGGYAQAAAALNKSQSAVSYGVQKLEHLLGVKVFEIEGRKAKLTAAGDVLYRRARGLIDDAAKLESAATDLGAGWEPQIGIAADNVFPTWLLLDCFALFAKERPETRIELYETVLGGTDEALFERHAELAICARVPTGFLGDPLMTARFVAAAHPDHPLHQLDRKLTSQDLKRHRQLVIRDSSRERSRSAGWLEAEQRWTVSHKATQIHAACQGLGFAWFPEENIRHELESGRLKPLPLRHGAEHFIPLYLVFADPDYAGPGTRRLAEIIKEHVKEECRMANNVTEGTRSKKRSRSGERSHKAV